MCSNCRGRLHDKENCWQKGGGAEGQKPTWMVMRDAERANASSKAEKARTGTKPAPALAAVANAVDDIEDYGSLPEFSCAGITEVAAGSLPTDAVLLDSVAMSHIICDHSLFW